MIRWLVGILIGLLAIGFSWAIIVLVIPLFGVLTGISALFSVLVGLGIFMVVPTIIIITIIFFIIVVPIKLIQNSKK